eukprot:5286167-Alexandrium_andersonii.AAC.1
MGRNNHTLAGSSGERLLSGLKSCQRRKRSQHAQRAERPFLRLGLDESRGAPIVQIRALGRPCEARRFSKH